MTINVGDNDLTPVANADVDSGVEGGSAVTGNVMTGTEITGDVNTTDGTADGVGDSPISVTLAGEGTVTTGITLGSPFATSKGGSLTLNTDGSYSYTPPAQGSVPEGGLVETFTYTITDADGDTSSTTLTINVGDVNYLPIDESYTPPLSLNNVAVSNVVDDLFDTGLDGFGNVTISKNFDLNLKSGGESLAYSNNADGNLIAKTVTSDTTVFAVTKTVSGNDVDYVFTLSAPLQLETTTDFNVDVLKEGGNKAYYWLLDDGTLASGGIVGDQPANTSVVVRGKRDNGNYANVNGNGNGLGSAAFGGQTIQDGEWVELTYLTAQASVEVGIGQGSNNAVPDVGTVIEIKLNGGSTLTFHGSDLVNGKLIINASDYSLITDITKVEVSATTINLVINSISTSSTTNVDDEILNFTYVGEDTDGDSASGEFSVLIEAGVSLSSLDSTGELIRGTDADNNSLNGTSGGDMIYGYDGADVLNGLDGNDVLIGGQGDDTLTGGGGADEFEWNATDTGVDLVVDFNSIEGDVLNLSDLLSDGNGATNGNVLTSDSNTGVLQLTISDASSNVIQVIEVQSVAVVDAGAAQVAMTSLLLSNNIDDGIV